MTTAEYTASKVPEVTLVFWIIKIAATTLGETGGDTVTMTLNLGYLIGTAIFFALLVILVVLQIAAKKFQPILYWATIVASTTAGTTLADFADRSLGVGYAGGLFLCLLAVLAAWYWSLGSISVTTVTTPKAEAFYWAAITLSQTLGTALGDWTADDTGLGYEGGALVFAAALLGVLAAFYWTRISRIFVLGCIRVDAALGRDGRRFSRQAGRRGRAGAEPACNDGCHRRVHHSLSSRPATARRPTPDRSQDGNLIVRAARAH
jgi:uncharacterized membrane-anchored protein